MAGPRRGVRPDTSTPTEYRSPNSVCAAASAASASSGLLLLEVRIFLQASEDLLLRIRGSVVTIGRDQPRHLQNLRTIALPSINLRDMDRDTVCSPNDRGRRLWRYYPPATGSSRRRKRSDEAAQLVGGQASALDGLGNALAHPGMRQPGPRERDRGVVDDRTGVLPAADELDGVGGPRHER